MNPQMLNYFSQIAEEFPNGISNTINNRKITISKLF